MSVQSIGQTPDSDWLRQLLAASSRQASAGQSDMSRLLSSDTDATGQSAATSSDSSASSSPDASASNVAGSFRDILTALLSGNGTLSYDIATGSLTLSDTASGTLGDDEGNLTRKQTETANADGSTTRTASLTDGSGTVVNTETTTENPDGTFSTVIAALGPDGRNVTRTITGEKTADGGFSITNTVTDANGHVLESGYEQAAADGSMTRGQTVNGPDGRSMTETESFDAAGRLVSTSSSSTLAATASASAGSESSGQTEASSAAGSSGSTNGDAAKGDGSGNTTTVTVTFTSEGLEQTTTVTDPEGKIVSQTVKTVPFTPTAQGENYGSTLEKADGLSGLLNEYAASRQGAKKYAVQQASTEGGGQQGTSLSVSA